MFKLYVFVIFNFTHYKEDEEAG